MANKKARSTPGSAKPLGLDCDAIKAADALLDSIFEEFLPGIERSAFHNKKLDFVPTGKILLAKPRPFQVVAARAALSRIEEMERTVAEAQAKLVRRGLEPSTRPWGDLWKQRWVFKTALSGLLRRELPLTEADIERLLHWQAKEPRYPMSEIAVALKNFVKKNSPSTLVYEAGSELLDELQANPNGRHNRRFGEQVDALLNGGPKIHIEPGEAWSDLALADLKKFKGRAAKTWAALVLHCQQGGKTKYTLRWREAAIPMLAALGFENFKKHALRWFPLVDSPRTESRLRENRWEPDYDQLIIGPHVELLRGLAWCCGFQEDMDLARALTRLALSSYRKIPGRGPRLVALGNACITSLGMMPGQTPIAQLAVLKVKVKFGTAQKEMEKAFNAAAGREGLPRDEIEELAVPAYGLDDVGRMEDSFGEYRVSLTVNGSTASLQWYKEDKPLKSVPAALKKEHSADLKEVQAAVKDINTMLPAQRERIDGLCLAQKTWPLAIWRERYLDHPLVGTLARRLIWAFSRGNTTVDGVWHEGDLCGPDGRPLRLKADSTVALWHPIGHATTEIVAWRKWFEEREVMQPFKQAHREVYLLTEAERRTRAYSNRFAGHVLRQHQFNALCAARGWKNKLRLMVDDTRPPAYRLLPNWNLRAEFWIEGAGEEFGRDTNDTGVYHFVTTDQVRFYPLDALQLTAHASGGGYGAGREQTAPEPLPLESIPPLVLSEILRDVDLFVGVTSLGNDPNWADGGPDGRYRDYWHGVSFGELTATAQTRRALLQRLIPRLKIAAQCTLEERYLVVRGTLRTYKIHLGSGNILMSPNDEYLCIVAKQAVVGQNRVFLPFEGDSTLSVILSKAFLLSDDEHIQDPTITSQLQRN